ncbi:MAG: hypothetical protein PVF89_08265 [Lysobacterales bacterium]|jgi:hypothetical protein
MSASHPYSQLSDLFVYGLLPVFSTLMPAALSRRMLRAASRWRWLMAAAAEDACRHAKTLVDVGDQAAWMARWKQVELLEVRDLFMMMCGRSGAVLSEVECPDGLELVRDRVLIGMHWGPSISILKLLQAAGFDPALPYRAPEKALLRQRPFAYLFSRMAVRYVVKTLGERAIPIGGAGAALRGLLGKPGSVFVVMDAPPMAGRPTVSVPVLGKNARFNKGFPAILAQSDKQYLFYAMSLAGEGSLRKRLKLEGPYTAGSAESFLADYGRHLEKHLCADSAHWRIWHVAGQLWADPAPETGTDPAAGSCTIEP